MFYSWGNHVHIFIHSFVHSLSQTLILDRVAMLERVPRMKVRETYCQSISDVHIFIKYISVRPCLTGLHSHQVEFYIHAQRLFLDNGVSNVLTGTGLTISQKNSTTMGLLG